MAQRQDPQKHVYEEIFNSFDVDQNGYLSVRELAKCMKALGDKLSPKDVKFLILCSDKDENGKMDISEFCIMAAVKNLVKMKELKELRDVFKSFDLDNNGSINVKELGNCMEKLGDPMTPAECASLIAEADKDADGSMSFFEFVIMVKSEKDLDDDQCMREAFNEFDTNHSGFIDKKEFRKALISLQNEDEIPTQAELDEMFNDADTDKDGEISFEEFKSIVSGSDQ